MEHDSGDLSSGMLCQRLRRGRVLPKEAKVASVNSARSNRAKVLVFHKGSLRRGRRVAGRARRNDGGETRAPSALARIPIGPLAVGATANGPPAPARAAYQRHGLHLLVSGLLKGLLLAPRQPGLVLFRQLRNSRFRRSVFLLDWRGGYRRFADGRRLVFLVLLLAFLCHKGSTYVPSSVLQPALRVPQYRPSRPTKALVSDSVRSPIAGIRPPGSGGARRQNEP